MMSCLKEQFSKFALIVFAIVSVFFCAVTSHAQDASVVDGEAAFFEEPVEGTTEASPAQNAVRDIKPNDIPSLLFTFWEHTALQDARRARGVARAPTKAEVSREMNRKSDGVLMAKPPPEEREIKLGGIVYISENDWTLWLNGKRVTPDAIPEEIIELRVYNEFIEVKWFDVYTNQIFPIRLRPHQRFNIDMRIFLPG